MNKYIPALLKKTNYFTRVITSLEELEKKIVWKKKKILTRAGYTCTAFRCTTPVHLYYTCFTPPNSYQFFGLGRKYHLLFYLVRQFPCLRLKITTWWYNIEVLDYIFFFFVVNFYNSGYHKH